MVEKVNGATWRQRLDQRQEEYLTQLSELVAIPSVSALPERRADVASAAEWVAARLRQAGVEHVGVHQLGVDSSAVYGDWLHAAGAPTVVVYGHYDVQPAQEEDGWSSPPFTPRVADNRLYGRGASDDKGNMLAPILATEAILATEGTLPINVKFFFEGQEEVGSPDLAAFVAAHKEMLAADFVLAADGSQWSETEPELTLSFRGLCALELTLQGPENDLHSGIYGGTVQNPIHALCSLVASLHDADGRVAVDGFYDDVVEPTPDQRQQFARVPFDEAGHLAATAAPALFGEKGWTTHERTWIRPTLEVNGIWGGFQGDGTKTVLPATAHAKITCRLVADQRPAEVVKHIEAHIHKHADPAVTVSIQAEEAAGAPYSVPATHPGIQAAAAVLADSYGRDPYQVGSGGTLPLCGIFLEHLGIYTVPFSFGLDDEGAHGPDEFFRLDNFRRAQLAYGDVLYAIAS